MSSITAGTTTPRSCRSKPQPTPKHTENLNPNVSPSPKKVPKQPRNPNSPQTKIRQRKFIVAKKKPKDDGGLGSSSTVAHCNCKEKKCVCVAYRNLRKSQEDFFKNLNRDDDNEEEEEKVNDEIESGFVEKQEGGDGVGGLNFVKRSRERLREEVRESVAQIGSGKVMNLVQAFEKLLFEPNSDSKDENGKQVKEDGENARVSGSLFCAEDLILTCRNLGLDPNASVCSSLDGSRGSLTSKGGRGSRRNSLESTTSTLGGRRRLRKKLPKVTRPEPFKLRTDQRGKIKEEEFEQKVQQMKTEEEKQRIPVAQGLPWTTDEPECLAKPPVKEITIPVDLKLHTDMRALGRAEFDEQVAEKLLFIEQYKLERERQQKLEEEEEIKRLRKELVPKAQPMPYFDRPFIPRRSAKCPTLPKTPKFHKKVKCSASSSSWSDMNSTSGLN
ncbi:microtubule-destabilizing protein 60-like [Vicia villosa]|uniref:microtubule-destabilizing protein 60-like n=1 Tax=Vicia villosa TaxID=3911 RepID=UPI00273A8AD9|nr:microtubule-destabilizing protein 60-like [Vicia villosa]